MDRPIKLFICYKKKLTGGQNEKAGILHYTLSKDREERFKPWMDETGLPMGLAWEKEIYHQILISDVLLVLIGPGTSESEWVKREIALASALGITIVPLGFDLDQTELEKELKALEIDHLQAKVTHNIKLNKMEVLLSELSADLQSAYELTKKQQKETLRDLFERSNPPVSKAADNQKAAQFTLSAGGRSIPVYVASGDISKVRNIDVLVNSENDYMQMARFFESRTVSSMLRRRGARIRDGKYEDTIQQELDWQLRDRGRPVQVAEVFATSAGGPGSELSKINKARYIFHVAAVQAVDAEGIVIPFRQPHQIEACVRATLSKVMEINQLHGVISPPDTEQRKEQELLAARKRGMVKSILLPLFGTGQGGRPAVDVIGPMIEGATSFLKDQDNDELATGLSEIYISAYKQTDLDDVVRILHKELS